MTATVLAVAAIVAGWSLLLGVFWLLSRPVAAIARRMHPPP